MFPPVKVVLELYRSVFNIDTLTQLNEFLNLILSKKCNVVSSKYLAHNDVN